MKKTDKTLNLNCGEVSGQTQSGSKDGHHLENIGWFTNYFSILKQKKYP